MTRPWIVKPHDRIEKLEPDLWSVTGDLRQGSRLRRRMSIARLSDGRLAFMNAVPLDDAAMRELEAWGAPAFLLVPTGFHRLDIAPWKVRYPALKLLTGESFRPVVAKVAPVDGGWSDFPRDPRVRLTELRGARGDIAVRAGGTLCLPGDVVFNQPHVGGLDGFLFRLVGSTGGPRVTRIAKWFLVSNRSLLRRELLDLAAEPGLERIVPCHGDIIRSGARAVLEQVASTL